MTTAICGGGRRFAEAARAVCFGRRYSVHLIISESNDLIVFSLAFASSSLPPLLSSLPPRRPGSGRCYSFTPRPSPVPLCASALRSCPSCTPCSRQLGRHARRSSLHPLRPPHSPAG